MGAPSGNKNHLVHGGYSLDTALKGQRRLDGRTQLARALNTARQALIQAVGGNPSPQQSILIDRIVRKVLVLDSIDAHVEEVGPFENGTLIPVLQKAYLGWSNSLRRDLEVLGLEYRARDVINLNKYLAVKASDGEATTEG